MIRDQIKGRNEERRESGREQLTRRSPSWKQVRSDNSAPILDGLLGTGVLKDQMKNFFSRNMQTSSSEDWMENSSRV